MREPEIEAEIAEPQQAQKPVKAAARKRKGRQATAKDDWNFFDPQETRFAALLAPLDEITSHDAVGHS